MFILLLQTASKHLLDIEEVVHLYVHIADLEVQISFVLFNELEVAIKVKTPYAYRYSRDIFSSVRNITLKLLKPVYTSAVVRGIGKERFRSSF